MLYPHHLRTVERLVTVFKDDPRFLALIVGGSLVKGYGDENSDVDIMLVAADDEYAQRVASDEYWYFNRELCDYPDGYVDGKVIDMQFLRDVADHGSQPARWAFTNAIIAFSHVPELEALVRRIPVYPDAEHERNLAAFYSQAHLMTWFTGEAEKRQNTYLMMTAVSRLVLFSGRLILAHNRIIYPYHKWFLRALADAPDKPDDLLPLMDHLMAQPTHANAKALLACVGQFRDWGARPEQAPARFMLDSEWTWRNGSAPVEDW